MAIITLKNSRRKNFMLLGILAFLLLQAFLNFFGLTYNFTQTFCSNISSYLNYFSKINLANFNLSQFNFSQLISQDVSHFDFQFFSIISTYVTAFFSFLTIGIIFIVAFYAVVKLVLLFFFSTEKVIKEKLQQFYNNSVTWSVLCFVKPNEKITA
ncbi:MAG: hypothetical protein WCR30_04190 [Clostridia bacterium]